jgi:hypothetical protein
VGSLRGTLKGLKKIFDKHKNQKRLMNAIYEYQKQEVGQDPKDMLKFMRKGIAFR